MSFNSIFRMVYFWEMELLKLKVADALKAEAGTSELPLAEQQPNRIYCAIARSPFVKRAIAEAYEQRKKDGWTRPTTATATPKTTPEEIVFSKDEVDMEVAEEVEDEEEEEVIESEGDEEDGAPKTYAAPWEMPPLSTDRINKKRDTAVKERALALSKR